MTQEIKPISQEIKLTTDQMKLMSLFQNLYQVISSKKYMMTQQNQKYQQFRTMTHLLTLENSVDYNLEFLQYH